jgi:hypothetical protein
MENLPEFKNELLEKLLALRTKINSNTCDAWETSLQETKVVVILEDFELSSEDEESNIEAYNGWNQDLDALINFVCSKIEINEYNF